MDHAKKLQNDVYAEKSGGIFTVLTPGE